MKLPLTNKFLFIYILLIIFTNFLSASEEGMPVEFDTVSLYTYYTTSEETGGGYWNPNFYFYDNRTEGQNCNAPTEFMINVGYTIYPHPGVVYTFIEPGGDYNPFLEGVFPLVFLRPRLEFYQVSPGPNAFEESFSKEPTWVIDDYLLYGDYGVPFESLDESDPLTGSFTIYSSIFPFPPPYEKLVNDPIYSAPPFLGLWEEVEYSSEPLSFDGYIGVSMEVMEMYSNERERVELFRLPYHYEVCAPSCSFQCEGLVIQPGEETPGLPWGSVVNPQSGIGKTSESGNVIYKNNDIIKKVLPDSDNYIIKYIQKNNINFSTYNWGGRKVTSQVNPPIGPYPDYIEIYRDDTGFHDAVATVNMSWVFAGGGSTLDRIEDELASTLEDLIYPDNETGPTYSDFIRQQLEEGVTFVDMLTTYPAILLRTFLNLPDDPEGYNQLKNSYIELVYIELDYELNPYSDERCPSDFTTYSTPVNNARLEGIEDIFELLEWSNNIVPERTSTIDEKNIDFPVAGMGTWVEGSEDEFEPLSNEFENLHGTSCEYTVTPTYYIHTYISDGNSSSNYYDKTYGDPFTVNINLYN
ncbi:MAG: hypothetical protein SVN78_02445 [Deferribacterota bacterium]|nr:hypothetical protein [Deferribacterota bacterium]